MDVIGHDRLRQGLDMQKEQKGLEQVLGDRSAKQEEMQAIIDNQRQIHLIRENQLRKVQSRC